MDKEERLKEIMVNHNVSYVKANKIYNSEEHEMNKEQIRIKLYDLFNSGNEFNMKPFIEVMKELLKNKK